MALSDILLGRRPVAPTPTFTKSLLPSTRQKTQADMVDDAEGEQASPYVVKMADEETIDGALVQADKFGNSADGAPRPKLNPTYSEGRIDPRTGMAAPLDTRSNYYGLSADGTRAIERIGDPKALGQSPFQIGGIDQLQGQLGDVYNNAGNIYGRTGAMAQNANTLGMGINAGQSRAAALAALQAPGPSAAESQLFSGQEAAARNALAMARSGRGFGSAGQMQQAIMAGQDGMQMANQQAATLRAQEEAQRRQQLLALSGQDLGALGQAQQFQLGAGQQGLQALQQSSQALQQTGQLSVLQQQALADRAKTNAAMQFDASKTNANFANYAQPKPEDNTARDWAMALNTGGAVLGAAASFFGGGGLGGFGGGGGGGETADLYNSYKISDERSKQRIQELETQNAALSAAFAAVPANTYQYKDPAQPGAAPGTQVGPMAQDLERTLPSTVDTGPDGQKRVDTGRLALANASATGELARRLAALEQASGKKKPEDLGTLPAMQVDMPQRRVDLGALAPMEVQIPRKKAGGV
jgi:hypothetical protein